jgi:hypothetical protein
MAVRGDISSIPKGLLPVHDLWILHFNHGWPGGRSRTNAYSAAPGKEAVGPVYPLPLASGMTLRTEIQRRRRGRRNFCIFSECPI